jgi:hypothetical protein
MQHFVLPNLKVIKTEAAALADIQRMLPNAFIDAQKVADFNQAVDTLFVEPEAPEDHGHFSVYDEYVYKFELIKELYLDLIESSIPALKEMTAVSSNHVTMLVKFANSYTKQLGMKKDLWFGDYFQQLSKSAPIKNQSRAMRQ